MLVRLVSAVRLGAGVRFPGELWELPDDEALSLIRAGDAVSVNREVAEFSVATLDSESRRRD